MYQDEGFHSNPSQVPHSTVRNLLQIRISRIMCTKFRVETENLQEPTDLQEQRWEALV